MGLTGNRGAVVDGRQELITSTIRVASVDFADEPWPQAVLEHIKAPEPTEEGFLRVWGVAALANNVQPYLRGGVRELHYRPPEEVFSPESIESWKGRTLCLLHPEQRGDIRLLIPENVQRHFVGSIFEVIPVPEAGAVVVGVLVQAAAAIEALTAEEPTNRITELSAGYLRTLVEQAGVAPNGKPHTHIQTEIRINHLAMVKEARAGRAAHIATDGAEPMLFFITQIAGGRWAVVDANDKELATFGSKDEAHTHAKTLGAEADGGGDHVIIQGVRVHKDDAEKMTKALGLSGVEKAEADAAQAKTDASRARAEADAARADLNRVRAERDAANAELTKLQSAEQTRELVGLRTEVKALLGDEAVTDAMDRRTLMCAVISATWKADEVATDGRDDAAIEVLFSAAKVSIARDRGQVADVNDATRGGGTDGSGQKIQDPQAARDAWLKKKQSAGADATT